MKNMDKKPNSEFLYHYGIKEENVSLNQLILYHLSKGIGQKL